MSPEQYGIIGITTAFIALLSPIYLMSLNGAINRFYHEYKGDQQYIRKVFGTIYSFVLLNSLIISGLIFALKSSLITSLIDDVDFYPYLAISITYLFFYSSYIVYQTSLQARQIGSKYSLNNLIFFTINISITLVLLVVLNMQALSILIGQLSASIILFFYSFIKFKREVKIGIDIPILKKSLKYSLPIIPHNLSVSISTFADRLIINKLLNISSVGIYNIGFQFGNIIYILSTAVNQAFVPWFHDNFKKNNIQQIRFFYKIIIYGYVLIGSFLSLFSKEICKIILDDRYFEAWTIIPYLSFAFVFNGIYYFYSVGLFYNIEGKGTKIIPFLTGTVALLNIVLNFILIPKFQLVGAGMASLISRIASAIIFSIVVERKFSINYKGSIVFLFVVLSMLVCLPISGFSIAQQSIFIRLIAFLIIVISGGIIFKIWKILINND